MKKHTIIFDSISINNIEVNICGRSYSDKEATLEFLDNMLLDVSAGIVTEMIFDVDSNKLSFDKPELQDLMMRLNMVVKMKLLKFMQM